MLGLFKQKKSLVELDRWVVRQGVLDNKPISVRFREGMLELKNREDYKHQIGVAVPLLNPTLEGLTTNEEAEELWKLEEKLEEVLKEAIFVVSITTNGMREFIFYAKEWKPEIFEQAVKNIIAEIQHKPQFMMQADKEWNTYREFAK